MILCSLTLTLYEISNSRESIESTTTTTTTITRGPTTSIWYNNCTIAGEGSGNNPDYCFAFYEKKDSVTSEAEEEEEEEEEDLDCCWTANERSTLSPLLRDVVTVHENGTM